MGISPIGGNAALPIATEIHAALEWGSSTDPETLRQLINWFKKVVNVVPTLRTVPTQIERKYIDERFHALCEPVAKAQGVPVAMAAQFVYQLATAEIAVADDSERQATASLAGDML